MSVVDPSNNHYVNSFLEKYKILARYMGAASGKGRVGESSVTSFPVFAAAFISLF